MTSTINFLHDARCNVKDHDIQRIPNCCVRYARTWTLDPFGYVPQHSTPPAAVKAYVQQLRTKKLKIPCRCLHQECMYSSPVTRAPEQRASSLIVPIITIITALIYEVLTTCLPLPLISSLRSSKKNKLCIGMV